MNAIARLRYRIRLGCLIQALRRSGLNLAQIATVIAHHERRGQLPLLFSEWNV